MAAPGNLGSAARLMQPSSFKVSRLAKPSRLPMVDSAEQLINESDFRLGMAVSGGKHLMYGLALKLSVVTLVKDPAA